MHAYLAKVPMVSDCANACRPTSSMFQGGRKRSVGCKMSANTAADDTAKEPRDSSTKCCTRYPAIRGLVMSTAVVAMVHDICVQKMA